jgi:hypothetical protein
MSFSTEDFFARHVCMDNKKNYCRSSDKSVKPKAYKPYKDGKTSVFLVTDLEDAEICSLGQDNVCNEKGIYGFARIRAKHIISELGIDLDNNPERHANIEGWPEMEEKEKIQDIAQILAANSECVVCE